MLRKRYAFFFVEINCRLNPNDLTVNETKNLCADMYCDIVNPASFCWCDVNEFNSMMKEDCSLENWYDTGNKKQQQGLHKICNVSVSVVLKNISSLDFQNWNVLWVNLFFFSLCQSYQLPVNQILFWFRFYNR